MCRIPHKLSPPAASAPVDAEFARVFANEWIDAWNAHDVERVLSHYSEGFEMTSPLIGRIMGCPDATLRGKPAVRDYWKLCLQRMSGLRFRLAGVFIGGQSLTVRYLSVQGVDAVEWLLFDERRIVIKAAAHYDANGLAAWTWPK
jgi:hypothetical protein